MNKKNNSLIIRNFTFGVEDSLVSTVGLLAGIAIAGMSKENILLTGFVLIFVEAFSMAIGSLLSEQSVEEYEGHKEVSLTKPLFAAVIMFFSYVFAGLIPLAPYFHFGGNQSVIFSVALTLVSLFLLGVFNAKLTHVRAWRDGLFTLFMGGIAILVGITVGQIAEKF
ncbi:VIT1/CCC1 transporter family protein [bacterium]|nr:MAG: VIT1/CCC1 transporter family protein [bacterium]